jgi:hypothetical protein
MTDRLAALELPEAAELIADWGFLVEPDLPDRPGPACLLVAIRKRPTLRHYDPEQVEFWVTQAGRGVPAWVNYATGMPYETDFSWGMLRITDRLHVTNEYLSFGGHLTADRVDDATIACFLSPAPLLRRGGHSQGWDPGASALGAFFGRLKAAVGNTRELEAQAGESDPVARYAAFVADFMARRRDAEALRSANSPLAQMLASEQDRLRMEHPDAWAAGQRLLAAAGLARSSAGA